MSELFEKAIVEKRNVLNEIRSNSMSLQEMRLFSIYLSKINSRDISTRAVRFPMEDFQKIMGIGIDINMTHFRCAIRHILQQIVEVPNEKGSGYTAFQLFKKAVVEKDENDEWYVELDAHDMALPLMFDFKERYFNYELWNALRLKSTNQLRMYEILKQYEKIGKRELSVKQLRELLGIKKNEYSDRTGWSNFRKYVLDSCQAALKEHTDICYTYERGKTGAGGKWLTIIFHISKNPNFVDKLSLKDFITLQPCPSPSEVSEYLEPEEKEIVSDDDSEGEILPAIAVITCDEFTDGQMREIEALLERLPASPEKRLDCLRERYQYMNTISTQKTREGGRIENRFAYLMTMLEERVYGVQRQPYRNPYMMPPPWDGSDPTRNDWMKKYL